MSFTVKNFIDKKIKEDMLKSFQHSQIQMEMDKTQKEQTPQFIDYEYEDEEPSMKWANKYLELQFKLRKTHKPQPTPYPYDYDK